MLRSLMRKLPLEKLSVSHNPTSIVNSFPALFLQVAWIPSQPTLLPVVKNQLHCIITDLVQFRVVPMPPKNTGNISVPG